MTVPTLRIGTRGSALAVAQAQEVKAAIEAARPGTAAEMVVIKTSGDETAPFTIAASDTPLPSVKGMFVKELEGDRKSVV